MIARINPQILTWARENQGLELSDVVVKSPFKKLDLWEKGQEFPSMHQVRSLAHLYKRPSALFFLTQPPAGGIVPTDFRSQKDQAEFPLSPETISDIRACESRREAALELAEMLEEPALTLLPELPPAVEIEEYVDELIKLLNVDYEQLSKIKNEKEALDYWIGRVESLNVLVFRSHTLNGWNSSFREVRGTSRFYEEYPWILLNSQEHPRGQLFTLGHELAHLLLHSGGVCALDEHKFNVHAEMQRKCNRFSAALLMPRERVEAVINSGSYNLQNEDELDLLIDRIQRVFHVSREAIARRLVSLRYIPWDSYYRIRQRQMEALRAELDTGQSGGGGQYFYKRVLSWNGKKYTALVTEAYQQKKISLGKATGYLHTKVKHFESIHRELYG